MVATMIVTKKGYTALGPSRSTRLAREDDQ
jgi:hypothetical protein